MSVRDEGGEQALRLPTVLVTGDDVIEWRFARSLVLQTPDASLDFVNSVRCYHEPGGPIALGRLIAAVSETRAKVIHHDIPPICSNVVTEGVACKGVVSYFPSAPPYWHFYNRCAQVQRTTNNSEAVWRILDILGTDRPLTTIPSAEAVKRCDSLADFVVVEDVRGTFAADNARWPTSLREPRDDAWLVMRWIPPSDFDSRNPSKLLLHVTRDCFLDRRTVVVTADELRMIGMRISKALSWERTAEDLVREVRARWNDTFRGCAHLIVSFLTDGAMVFSSTSNGLRARLYYDPNFAEGEWTLDKPGRMVGSARCLTAAIVSSMLAAGNRAMSDDSILAGVAAARLLHENGFLVTPSSSDASRIERSYPEDLRFPAEKIAELLRPRIMDENQEGVKLPRELAGLRCTDVSVNTGIRAWRLMDIELGSQDEVITAASRIVAFGDDTYPWPFPIARFGDFLAIDRLEIESLRAVRELMKNYLASTTKQRPISIAVFGSPGNGKSFAVTEIARQLGGSGMTARVFNLSQFESPDAIHKALHQVQNISVTGDLPLVFWDEFDAHYGDMRFGWLRFFLGPMQEGTFHEGQITHSIGKAIFVFAGGTSSCKAEFDEQVRSVHGHLAKGPDFMSRLHGYVDIADLNYSDKNLDAPVALRRAVRLRALLSQSAGSLVRQYVPFDLEKQKVRRELSVDPGILRAFLLVPEYRHGARSMEAIIKMSALSGKYRYDRSSLPPFEQLQLHVEAERFLALVDSL